MIISPRITDPPTRQLRLFPEQLKGHGHRRTIIGDLVENLTAEVFGGFRHRCHAAADYCPDVSVGDAYLEVKAMGRSKSSLIYGGRIDKDRAFVDAGHRLFYVVWAHSADTLLPRTRDELEALILLKLEWVAVIPFDHLEQLCLWTRPSVLNSGYGSRPSNRQMYGWGYRLPARFFEPWIVADWQAEFSSEI